MKRIVINGISILFLFSLGIKAQSQPEKFVIGAYAQSVPDLSYRLEPPLLEEAKINHIMFIGTKAGADAQNLYLENGLPALLPYNGSGASTTSNLNRLAQFSGVILGNNSANTQIVRPFLASANTTVSNFDWIYYLSSAYHNKFDATVKKYERTDSTIELYHGCGDTVTVDGEFYWSSSGPTYYYNPTLVVLGPSYALETRYRGANDAAGNPDTVQYEVKYNMRLREPYQAGQPDSLVARIYVYATYADNNYNPAQIKDTILSSRDLRRSVFNYADSLKLQFGLAGFRESLGRPDTTLKYVLQTVEFRVKKLSDSLEFLIKEIECYDTRIWKKYFTDGDGTRWRKSHITTYLSTFTGSSAFADKFKYVMTIDEPHTIASYDAIRIISEDLDSLRILNPKTPRLHTHFYPGWNGLRERSKYYTLKNWLMNANPEPLVFYYIHQKSDSPTVAIDVVRNLVHQASKFNDNKPYYFVINTWNEPSSGWRHPRKWELRADVMLALATGCKGIFYEPFYSYSTVEGLVAKDSDPPVFNELGLYVRDSINARLDTTLGYTLLDYKYTGLYGQTYHQPDSTIKFHSSFNAVDSVEYVSMAELTEGQRRVFSGLFRHKTNQKDLAVLIVNYDSIKTENLPKIYKPGEYGGYNNIRLRNSEGGYDTVFTIRLKIKDTLEGGDGKLYLIKPVLRNGGTLICSDTVKSADTLRENILKISSGTTLTIDGNYTASQDIVVETGGKLIINPGKTLTFTDGAKLRVYGEFVDESGIAATGARKRAIKRE